MPSSEDLCPSAHTEARSEPLTFSHLIFHLKHVKCLGGPVRLSEVVVNGSAFSELGKNWAKRSLPVFSVPQALEMRDHTVPSSVLLIGNLGFKKKKEEKWKAEEKGKDILIGMQSSKE